MTRYSEWDRFNERWGAISIRKEAFKSILEAIESDKLVDVAKDIGSHVPKEFIVFWFKKINLETYLEYLSLVCHYAKFAECEIDNHGNDYTIILSHDIGQKWSDFLATWLSEGLKVSLGVIPKIDTTRNSIVVRFRMY
jgi:ethanolamine utilization protein EutP (predicted NTPase)